VNKSINFELKIFLFFLPFIFKKKIRLDLAQPYELRLGWTQLASLITRWAKQHACVNYSPRRAAQCKCEGNYNYLRTVY
jgi:hypothetical protein